MSDEIIRSEASGEYTSRAGISTPNESGNLPSSEAGETGISLPDDRPLDVIENDDPFKRRVRNPRNSRGLLGLAYRVYHLFTPEPTAEQIAQMEEAEKRKLQDKVLLADAKTAEKRMINRLTGMGICYEYRRKSDGPTRFQEVRFDIVKYEPNAIWFHVDTHRLPHRVSIAQLKAKDTVDNLSMATGHAITCQHSPEKGVWYVMERASGAMGIPTHVAWVDMMRAFPASRDHLTIAMGMGSNNRPYYNTFNKMTHMLVAGASGYGKSVFLNNMLCTLLMRNTPDQLKIALVDLKEGNTFMRYEGIPHLLTLEDIAPDGVCRDRELVFKLLDSIIDEAHRRMNVFNGARCSDIGEYNSHRRKNRMGHWVLIIDEWADVYLGAHSGEAVKKLVNIAQRCRSVGIHLVVCTQVPKAQILDTMITANLPARVVFHFPTFQGSRAALDNGHAHGLGVRGRAIYLFEDELTIQAPYISNEMVEQVVAKLKSGEAMDYNLTHDVTQDEVRSWALHEQNGYLRGNDIRCQFLKRGITQAELQAWVESWDDHEFLIDGSMYRCEPPAGSRARRLVAINEPQEVHAEDNPPALPEPEQAS